MQKFASGVGLIPEQDWELPDLAASPFGTDPTLASIGFQNGHAAGSAAPLTWSAASFVRLAADLDAGTNVALPKATEKRYKHPPGETTLTVTSPADKSAVSGSPVTVAGVTEPGNTVYVSATNTDQSFETTTASLFARTNAFSIPVPISGGTTVLNVVAVSPNGATAHALRTVVFDTVQGTLLFDATDQSGDDNGPGTYAYPTSADFQPGAYDLQDFQVYDTGSTVTFRVRTRDLTPTFGSPLGAQLVDVYAHEPGASPTSTAASFPQRNYTIAPAYAWSRLIEVQGFGQRYVDATNTNTVGTISISANEISRLHHVPRLESVARRDSRQRLVVHDRAHRPGRLQRRPGPRLPADAAAVPVRSLRAGWLGAALQHRSEHDPDDDSEGARRVHAAGRRSDVGAQPVERPGRAAGRHDALAPRR
jgi:hypothetical protein